ncbi:hypothetical protein SEVIR_8G117900v4 [Setaria viridis]|uniref:Uncharacterized protein n=2 Tax=Setaria TaxID=4554 RepID=K3ZMA0_SETIT|nr:hypothetical protein SETIT_8G112600v2 [Setaria italica]TKW00554.1 hypothetical protein SEVIR_8G117900v2 [Setaria viridis]
MASSLTSALSSMEVMLDALMQRGIGKPEEQKPKEEEPPALPTRPTGRGRLPSLQRSGAAAPWIHRPPLPSPLSPPQEEDDEEKCLVNLELERRAAKAEEEVKKKEEEMRQKEELIATLRQQVEQYESRLSECEVRMKSVEEELQKQITSLQMAQTAGGRRGGLTTTSQHRQESSSGNLPPSQSSARRQQRGCEPAIIAIDESSSEVNQLAREFKRQSEAFEYNARAVAEAKPSSPSSAKSVKELKTLKRQFASWKKEYEAQLKKTKAELKRLVHTEKKNHGDSDSHQRRCGWWRIKASKCCRAPKCCSFKLPSPKSCGCCFRRCW